MNEPEPTDGELLAAYRDDGNDAAFTALVQRHAAMVHAVAGRVLGDNQEAQDVAQATFLTLVRKAAALRAEGGVGAWLHHVAWCLARNASAARASRCRREAEASRQQPANQAPEVEREAWRAALDGALAELPERYRQPLVLFHLEGRSLAETASLLRLSPATLRTRLSRGRERLRRRLDRHGVALGADTALTDRLSAEAGAAALPASFVSATVTAASLAAAGKLAAGVAAGTVSASVAALTEGALKMLFWNSVKTAAVIAAASVAIVGGGLIVAQELAPVRTGEPPTPAAKVQPSAPATAVAPEKDGKDPALVAGRQPAAPATELAPGRAGEPMPELLAQAQERWRQGKTLRTDGDPSGAQKAFQEAAALFSSAATAYPNDERSHKAAILAGQSLMQAQEWDAAIRTLLPLTTKDTIPAELKPEAMYWLGDCYRKKDDLPNAYRIFKRLTWDYPESLWAKYARGRLTEDVFQNLDRQ